LVYSTRAEKPMAEQTSEETREQNIKAMGEELGIQYTQLWQETAQLNIMWKEFLELYGTKPGRIELLNRSAAAFFRMVQNGIWEAIVLHIARLTDPPHSQGRKDRPNLTLHNLPGLISDVTLKDKLRKLCDEANANTEFARDWRNRRIAHRDLDLALGGKAKPLPTVSIKHVQDALKSFDNIMNSIALPYMNSTTSFDHGITSNGAVELLYLLDDGLTLRAERKKRLTESNYEIDPFPIRDL
jgi:AbiU2